jgi:putative flippase GtrA
MKRSIFSKADMTSQFIKFSIVGVVNSLVQFIVFLALYRILHLYYLLASGIGYGAGMINSYLLNKHWTFMHRKKRTFGEIARFVIVNAAALAVNLLVLKMFKEAAVVSIETGQVFAIGFSLVVNFLGNRHWTFRTADAP